MQFEVWQIESIILSMEMNVISGITCLIGGKTQIPNVTLPSSLSNKIPPKSHVPAQVTPELDM